MFLQKSWKKLFECPKQFKIIWWIVEFTFRQVNFDRNSINSGTNYTRVNKFSPVFLPLMLLFSVCGEFRPFLRSWSADLPQIQPQKIIVCHCYWVHSAILDYSIWDSIWWLFIPLHHLLLKLWEQNILLDFISVPVSCPPLQATSSEWVFISGYYDIIDKKETP